MVIILDAFISIEHEIKNEKRSKIQSHHKKLKLQDRFFYDVFLFSDIIISSGLIYYLSPGEILYLLPVNYNTIKATNLAVLPGTVLLKSHYTADGQLKESS